MTVSDWELLALYRNKRGPLNPMLRMEAGFGMLSACVLNAAGAKKQDGSQFTAADFMPWAVDKKEVTLDDMILEWARTNG